MVNAKVGSLLYNVRDKHYGFIKDIKTRIADDDFYPITIMSNPEWRAKNMSIEGLELREFHASLAGEEEVRMPPIWELVQINYINQTEIEDKEEKPINTIKEKTPAVPKAGKPTKSTKASVPKKVIITDEKIEINKGSNDLVSQLKNEIEAYEKKIAELRTIIDMTNRLDVMGYTIVKK